MPELPDSGIAAIIAHWRMRERHHTIAVQAGTLTLAGQLEAVAVRELSEIGFGVALIEPGTQTGEGVVVAAVSPAWRRFLKLLAEDPNAFMTLDPRQMEELIAGDYAQDGWTVTLTPRSGDGGRDIIAVRHDVGSIRILDQVKRYKPGHLVSAEEVRAMFGVLNMDRRASKACITTSSGFAPGVAGEFADWMPTRLELRDGVRVREMLATWTG